MTISFCAETKSRQEVLEMVIKILLIPDLYNAIKKYTEADRQEKEKYLKRLKREAHKQWHSDVRTTKDPQAEHYSRCIDEALEIFKIIGNSPEHFVDPIKEEVEIPKEQAEPETSFAEMQEKLRNTIDEILKKCRKTTDTIEINKGAYYSDIIKEEQELKNYEPALYALLFYSLSIGLFLELIVAIAPFLAFILYPVSLAVLLICHIAIIPFSRFWFFSKIPFLDENLHYIINFGSIGFEKSIIKIGDMLSNLGKQGLITLLLVFPFFVCSWISKMLMYVFGLIMLLFYEVALRIAGTKKFNSITKEQNFYDGIADWYIYEILSKPETELTDQEKQLVYYFYNAYL